MNSDAPRPTLGQTPQEYSREFIEKTLNDLRKCIETLLSPGVVRAAKLNLSQIPSSTTGLRSGDAWNDNSFIRLYLGSSPDTLGNAAIGSSYNLYVAKTGSDSNTGLTVGSPFLTIQKACDTVAVYAPFLGGSWDINIGAGTYTEEVTIAVASDEFIDFKGVDVSGGTPTVIIDGNADALAIGFDAGPYCQVRFFDIKFQNFSFYGVLAQLHTDIALFNCHVTGCNEAGAYADKLVRMWVYGGKYDSNTKYGILCFGGSTLTAGIDARYATSPQANSNGVAGVQVREGSNARLDDFTADGNTTAGILTDGCFVNLVTVSLDNSTYGILARRGGSWFDNGITYGSGLTYRFANKTGSIEIDVQADFGSEFCIISDPTPTSALTGVAAATLMKTLWTVPTGWFVEPGKKLRVSLKGGATGAVATKTIEVRLAGGNIAQWTTISAGTVSWKIDVDIWATGSAAQSYSWQAFNGATPITPVNLTRTVNMASGGDLAVYGTVSGAADTLTIQRAEAYYIGG